MSSGAGKPVITYKRGAPISIEQFIDVLERSTLAKRRPVGDRGRIRKMLENANLTLTAWDGDKLVGVARSLTDFSFCCYMSDLAVDRAYQGRGIGKELIERTRQEIGDSAMLLLLSAPAATTYYPHVGFQKADNAWIIRK